ncbi:MAG: glycogen-debranching protein, partial [Vulcanococcus sp.]
HREWHGLQLGQPDWASWSHSLAWSLNEGQRGPLLWCGLNAYHEPLRFAIPTANEPWLRLIDTGQADGDQLPEQPQPLSESERSQGALLLRDRSLVLLVAAPLMARHQA